jgi:hypothetical protein
MDYAAMGVRDTAADVSVNVSPLLTVLGVVSVIER